MSTSKVVALLIDPSSRTVREVEVLADDACKSWQSAIGNGCTYVTVGGVKLEAIDGSQFPGKGGISHDLYVDEDGLRHPTEGGFFFAGRSYPFVGRGLIVAGIGENIVNATASGDSVARFVTWLSNAELGR